MRRVCARLLLAATICLLGGGQAIAQTASLRFTQGTNVGASGQALKGVVGTIVSIANSSSAGIQSWQIDVYYAPPGSSLALGTLAANDSSTTPVATFTPDKPGGYRFGLKVWSSAGRHGSPANTDIRTFLVGARTNGFIPPPWQSWPVPLPPPASGLPTAKPDEINPSGCAGGYAGCGSGDGLLNDFIATVDSKLPKTVANAAALAALDTTDAANGLQVYVVSVGDWFELAPSSGATAQPLVLIAATDGRQWKRQGRPNRHFLAATYWSVSTTTGSDENAGWGMSEAAADARPLATMIELNRRLAGWSEDNTAAGLSGVALSIHLMDAAQTTSTFAVLTNLQRRNSEKYIRVRGTLAPVDGSASNLAIAAYQPAVPASNTEREITITGLGLKPTYVGKIIQTTDGVKTATVTRQRSSDHLSISQVRDNYGGIHGDGSNVTDFVVGDHVTVSDASKLAGWPFPPAGVVFPLLANVRLDAGATFPYSVIGSGVSAAIVECIMGSGVANAHEFYIDGGTLSIQATTIFSTHANYFYNGSAFLFSVGVLINGDGPLIDNYSVTVVDEALFTPYGGGGNGLAVLGSGKSTVAVADVGVIGSFGMGSATITLVNTHQGIPGDFVGSDSNTGDKSRWYGSGNTGLMIVLPKGTRSKFPKGGVTVTTSAAHPINMAGIGVGDTSHNYDWADIPILDLASGSALQDSSPASF